MVLNPAEAAKMIGWEAVEVLGVKKTGALFRVPLS